MQNFFGRGIRHLLHKVKQDIFLNDSFGIIHIGASTGQERFIYDELDLDVVWIEANPETATTLQHNIKDYPKQIGYQGLMTDRVGKQYDFKIANHLSSSSIFDLALHLEVYPHVLHTDTISLTSTTLTQFIDDQQIDISKYRVLLLDIEGSELLVMKGAENILSNFDVIITEVSDFECYKDCYTLKELKTYLHKMGFLENDRILQNKHPKGNCYDILYTNFRINTLC
jgi:FkbM family methyltransferase